MKPNQPRRVVFVAALAGSLLAFGPSIGRGQVPRQPGLGGVPGAGANTAAKQVQDAQTALQLARTNYTKARTKVEAQFKTKDDWVKAQKALDKAKFDAETAKSNVLTALLKNPDYKAARALKDSTEQKMRAAQEAGNLDEANKLADQLPALGIEISKAERETLAADPKYAEASARLKQAQQDMAALQTQVDDAAKTDPECLAAQQQVDAAQQQLAAAQQARAAQAKSEADARAAAAKARASSSSGGGLRGGGGYK